jgi:hypothetical protein
MDSALISAMLRRRGQWERCCRGVVEGETRLDPGAAQGEQPDSKTRLRQELAREIEVAGALELQHLLALNNEQQRLLECEFGERWCCGRGCG